MEESRRKTVEIYPEGRNTSTSNLAQVIQNFKEGTGENEEFQKEENVNKTKRKLATIVYALVLIMTGVVSSPLTPLAKTATRVYG
jgi:hypothetical protein